MSFKNVLKLIESVNGKVPKALPALQAISYVAVIFHSVHPGGFKTERHPSSSPTHSIPEQVQPHDER
jgi:hypothetical protein